MVYKTKKPSKPQPTGEGQPKKSASTAAANDTPPGEASGKRRTSRLSWVLAIVGIAVAASAASGFGAYYLFDQRLSEIQHRALTETQGMNSRIAELTAQLSTADQQNFASRTSVEELAARIEQVQDGVDAQAAVDADTVAGLESRIASAGTLLEPDLRRLADSLAELTTRLSALERDRTTNVTATVALARLAQAVQGSQPFVHALNAYEQASHETVAPLLRVAAMQGIDSRQTLRDQFPLVARRALAAGAAQDEVGGLIGAWRRWLAHLVPARPPHANLADLP